MEIFLGPAGNCKSSKEQGTLSSFDRVNELGLNAQELEFVHSVYLKPEQAPKIRDQAKSKNVQLSIHAPYYINLCTADSSKFFASMKRISDSLNIASILEAKGAVAVHPGFFQTRDKTECFDAVAKAAKTLALSYPNAILGFETTGKHSAFGSFTETLEICKQVNLSNCVPVIDFAHLFARNNGKIDYSSVLDTILDYDHTILHAHFSSIAYTDKGEANHLPLSANQPSFEDLAKELKKRKTKFKTVNLVCESPLMENDALVMKQTLEKLGMWNNSKN